MSNDRQLNYINNLQNRDQNLYYVDDVSELNSINLEENDKIYAINDNKLFQMEIVDQEEELSGSIVSFNGRNNTKIKSLVADIEPKQSGSGDPSLNNIRPISGWTRAMVNRTSKNLFNNAASTIINNGITFTVTTDGNVVANGTATAVAQIKISISTSNLKPGNYYFTALHEKPTNIDASVYVWNATNSEMAKKWNGTDNSGLATNGSFQEFRIEDGYEYRLQCRINTGATVTNLIFNPMICASTETDPIYKPYTGTEISVAFPPSAGTIYGAKLTVNPDRTGALVVEYAKKTFNGSESWAVATNGYRTYSIDYADGVLTEDKNIKSNYLVHKLYNQSNGQPHFTQSGIVDNHNIFVRYIDKVDSSIVDVASFKTYLAEHPLEVVYKLANPIEYQLTESEISDILTTFYGTNNIWANTGDITVKIAEKGKTAFEFKPYT